MGGDLSSAPGTSGGGIRGWLLVLAGFLVGAGSVGTAWLLTSESTPFSSSAGASVGTGGADTAPDCPPATDSTIPRVVRVPVPQPSFGPGSPGSTMPLGTFTADQLPDAENPEVLRERVSRCELQLELPQDEPLPLWDVVGDQIGLDERQKRAAERAIRAEHRAVTARLRSLYEEATGEVPSQSLAPKTLFEEIEAKSTYEEVVATFERVSRELAGLQAPPQDPEEGSPFERSVRLLATVTRRITAAVEPELGRDRARQLRLEARAFLGGFTVRGHCPMDATAPPPAE